jgi:ComF family protein
MPAKVDRALALLFPRACRLCGLPAGRGNVCAGCRGDLPWIRAPCRSCGAPLPDAARGDACGECRVAAGVVDRIRTALVYEYPVDQLVSGMKFRSRADDALALGELLAVYLRAARLCGALRVPDLLAPVPLHHARLARRGFNQSAEIARPLARMLQASVLTRGCRRVFNTVEQTTLSGAARRANVRGAFRVTHDLRGATVAVVDDVLTTGSTSLEFAAVLRAAGAIAVEIWTVARSLPR